MAPWKREHILMLIDLYKQHPFMYDHKHEDFYHRIKREDVTRAICKEMQKVRPKTCAFEVMLKMRTLKVQYATEKQSMIKEGRNEPKLWCYQELSFLDGHLKERRNPKRLKNEIKEEDILDENIVETVITEPDSVTFGDDQITIEDVPSYDSDDGFTMDSEESHSNKTDFEEDEDATIPTKKIKKEPEEEETNVVRETSSALEICKDNAKEPHEESREEIFGKFVDMEMKQIKDVNIYKITKWNIVMALIEGLKRQTDLDKS